MGLHVVATSMLLPRKVGSGQSILGDTVVGPSQLELL